MVRSELDLSRGSFAGGRLEGVFLATDLRLPAPSAPQRIKLGGVFNSLTLTVPEGTPVHVHGPGLPFNAVDRGGNGAPGRPGYDVNVEGIFTAVDVRIEPTSAHPPAEAEPSTTAHPRRRQSRAQRADPSPKPCRLRSRTEPQASCSRNPPQILTNTLSTTIARMKCAARTYQTYSGCPRSWRYP